jgi:glycerate-2-kinase
MLIKNHQAITSHGNNALRKTILEIIEAGLAAADPYQNVRKMLRVENGKLYAGLKEFAIRGTENLELPLVFDVSKIGNVYIFGGGKAVQRIALAIEDALGDLVTDGQINVKKGEPKWCRKINVTFAGHPLPDEDGVRGAQRKYELERQVKPGDLVFHMTSGGGTATLGWPAPGITLQDLRDVTYKIYFEKGASMPEKNAVVSRLRVPRDGGPKPGIPVIFISSSETPPGTHNDHHRSFPSTDAIEILKRYGAWDEISDRVKAHLERVHDDPMFNSRRTPIHSEYDYDTIYSFRAIGPEYMLAAAQQKAQELGIQAHIMCSSLNDIEASSISGALANIAREVDRHGRPFQPPCILLFGGEPTVSIGKATGVGGRNQEFALAAAPWLEGNRNILVAAIDSDGTDGPTEVAGGIVDGFTMERAASAGLDMYTELDNHNSYTVLTKLGDAFLTGQLGQNLRSLFLVYIDKAG